MQQINLYQDRFKKEKQFLSAVALVFMLALAMVVLATVHTLGNLELEPLQNEQARLALQIDDLTKKVAVAEQEARPQPEDKLLKKEVEQLVIRLQHNQRLLRALTEGAMSNTRGFSEYFEAIANRHVNGTWITNMQIASGGFKFAFAGKSVTPELVPRYLQNLSDEQVFENFSFNILEIERREKESPVVDFNISTGNG